MREVSSVVPVAIESRVMKTPALSSLNGLADIGLRSGVDMRPTLIRVLTDLYVQKLTHTADEERHYTELALRLLDGVDVPTRAAVAARLAKHLSPPLRVIQYLVNDLPDVAAPLRGHALLQAARSTPRAAAGGDRSGRWSTPRLPNRRRKTSRSNTRRSRTCAAPWMRRPPASSTIFSSPPRETSGASSCSISTSPRRCRRGRSWSCAIPASASAWKRRRWAIIARNSLKQLAEALRIPREQARRIVRDDHGEPIVVAVKALGIPRDVVYRLLMFVNPAVGHSVERVHALATLYRRDDRASGRRHGRDLAGAAQRGARDRKAPAAAVERRALARPSAAAPARRPLAAPRTNIRREVS